METKEVEEVNSIKYLEDTAKLIEKQVDLMIAEGSPLSGIVNLCYLRDYLYKVYCHGRITSFEDAEGNFIGTVGSSFAEMWWAQKSVCLVEEFVVGNCSGFGRIALRYLDRVAKETNCKVISSGNFLGTQPKMIENMYMKHGKFDLVRQNFIKVVH